MKLWDRCSMIDKSVNFSALNDVVLALQIWNSGNATFVASFVKQEGLCISIDLQSIEMQLENIKKVIFRLYLCKSK